MPNEIMFSIIIPTYNSSPFIEETLESVCNQTYQGFEVIISDDCSTDNTVELIASFFKKHPNINYQILKSKINGGAGAARNKAVNLATFDWIAFLDSDDYWVDYKLAHVVDVIQKNDTNYIFHNEIYLENNKERKVDYILQYDESIHPFIALVRRNFLSPTSAIIHQTLFERAGGFDTSLRSAQDYDLWLRMSLSDLKLHPIQEYLAYYRVREGNITSNVQNRLDCLLKIINKHKNELKNISPDSRRELKHWKGYVYSSCGVMFFRKKDYLVGGFYIVYGQFFNFRVDWVKRLGKIVGL